VSIAVEEAAECGQLSKNIKGLLLIAYIYSLQRYWLRRQSSYTQ